MEHPLFLSTRFSSIELLLLPGAAERAPTTPPTEASPRSEIADTRADVPGGRVRRVVRQ
jgi:hypothetical protein